MLSTLRSTDRDPDVYAMLLHALQTKEPVWEDIAARYTWQRLAPKTRATAASLLRNLHSAGRSATPFGLTQLLILMEVGEVRKLASSTVTGIKDAIARTASSVGVFFDPGSWTRMKAAMKCYSINNPPMRKEKGAIDIEQFRQLIELVRERGGPYVEENVAAITVQYAFGFRGDNVMLMKRIHFRHLTNEGWSYCGPRHKEKKRDGVLQEVDFMSCMPDLQEEIGGIMDSVPSDDANRLFPFYHLAWCSKIVKEAAQLHGWNDMLNWCGSHCLRHGSAVQAAGPEGNVADAAARLSCTMANAAHYCRSEDTRVTQTEANLAGLGGPATRGRKPNVELGLAKATLEALTPTVRKRPWTHEFTKQSEAAKRRTNIARSSAVVAVRIQWPAPAVFGW